MYRKSILIISIVVILNLLIGSSVIAKSPNTSKPFAPVVALGQPGLSFRYDQTLGTTSAPYLDENSYLNYPVGVATDLNDNVYILEQRGKRLLKFDDNGSFLYKIGIAGTSMNGDYSFDNPYDAVIDQSNNLWIVESNRVVKYSSDGTYLLQFPAVDSWQSGSTNDRFNYVTGIAFDGFGRMYVADSNNQRVQVFSFDGEGNPVWIKTIGTSDEAGSDIDHFNYPRHIAIGNGQLFVADPNNQRVQVFNVSGADADSIAYLATMGVSGVAGTDAQHFDYPSGVAVNAAYILVSENGNNRLQVFDAATREYLTTITTFGTGLGFVWVPDDVAFDSSGNVYVADSYNHRVQLFTRGNGATWSYTRMFGHSNEPYRTDTGHFNKPRVAVDSNNNLIVLEEDGQRLLKFDPNGGLVFQVGMPGIERDPNRGTEDNQHFSWPHGVAAGPNGKIYVADNNRVQIYGSAGDYIHTIGGDWGNGDYQFNWATGIAVDHSGNIYVSDCPNHRVQIYDSSYIYVTSLGVNGVPGLDNAHFNCPIGVEVDGAGNIYIADINNYRVQKFNSSLVYQMTFGRPGSSTLSFADVSAEDVTVDSKGRVYVAGWDNRVEVFDASGAYLTTIGGAGGTNSSQFNGASGVAVDNSGNVYVSDFNNSRVQKFSPGVPGWKQTNINGFGNVNNTITALEVYNSQLYAGTNNWNDGTQIWRTADGYTWNPVTTQGAGIGAGNSAILDMIEFGGKLYAGTGWSGNPPNAHGEIWRSIDGTTWDQIVADSFGDAENQFIYTFIIYNNWLYVSTWAKGPTHGTQIWRSSTGNANDWHKVFEAADLNNVSVISFAEFNGDLYAGVENSVDGMEILRTSNGTVWSPVMTGGFGDYRNKWPGGMAVFKGNLYVTTETNEIPGQIWRSGNGTTWTQVPTPGFETNDSSITSPFVFRDQFYVFNQSDGGEQVWRTANGSQWQKANIDGFGDSNSNWTGLGSNSIVIFQGKLVKAIWNTASAGKIWEMLMEIYLPVINK